MLDPAQVFDLVWEKIGNMVDGTRYVIARDQHNRPLIASWTKFDPIQGDEEGVSFPGSIHVSIEIPDPPPQTKVENWFARRLDEDGRTSHGTSSVSMDFTPTVFTSYEALPDGLRLNVAWQPASQVRVYEYAWVEPEELL